MEIYYVDKIFLLNVMSIFKMTWTNPTFGCARLGKATLGSICDGKLVNNWFKSRLTIILVCSITAHLTSLIIVFSVAAIRYQIVVCCWDPKLTRYMNTPLFHATPGLIGEFPLVLSWISPCFVNFPLFYANQSSRAVQNESEHHIQELGFQRVPQSFRKHTIVPGRIFTSTHN